MTQPHVNNKAVVQPLPAVVAQPESGENLVISELRARIEKLEAFPAKVQTFFDTLISERNRPHCGQQWREMIDGLSRRARGDGLWSPPD